MNNLEADVCLPFDSADSLVVVELRVDGPFVTLVVDWVVAGAADVTGVAAGTEDGSG